MGAYAGDESFEVGVEVNLDWSRHDQISVVNEVDPMG